jgi:hypothetical protein
MYLGEILVMKFPVFVEGGCHRFWRLLSQR